MFQSPLGEVVKETAVGTVFPSGSSVFQSPLGEVVKETSCLRILQKSYFQAFQSPLGEVVKETNIQRICKNWGNRLVSIPSRGSGKGDQQAFKDFKEAVWEKFQSPLGEVVKETQVSDRINSFQ